MAMRYYDSLGRYKRIICIVVAKRSMLHSLYFIIVYYYYYVICILDEGDSIQQIFRDTKGVVPII